MWHRCDVKKCEDRPSHVVSIGMLKISVCSKHHESMFELGRKFDEAYINLVRKYFHLAFNLPLKGDKP